MKLGLRGFLLRNRLVDDAHDVGFLHDEEFLAINLDLGARPFAEQHAITFFDIDRNELAGVIAAPGPTARTSPCEGFSWQYRG